MNVKINIHKNHNVQRKLDSIASWKIPESTKKELTEFIDKAKTFHELILLTSAKPVYDFVYSQEGKSEEDLQSLVQRMVKEELKKQKKN